MKIGNIVLFEFLWHKPSMFTNTLYLLPTIRFDYIGNGISFGKGSWTIDILWLRLFITFGYVKPIKK